MASKERPRPKGIRPVIPPKPVEELMDTGETHSSGVEKSTNGNLSNQEGKQPEPEPNYVNTKRLQGNGNPSGPTTSTATPPPLPPPPGPAGSEAGPGTRRQPAHSHKTDGHTQSQDQDMQETNVDDGKKVYDKDQKKSKDEEPGLIDRFTAGGKRVFKSVFGIFHRDAKVEIKDSKLVIQTITDGKNLASKENKNCCNLYVHQPYEPTSQHVNGITVEWILPSPRYCVLESLTICFRDNKRVLFTKDLKSTVSKYKVPNDELLCGTNYDVDVITNIRHCDDTVEKFPSSKNFFTQPGHPRHIEAFCSDDHVDVQWFPSKGAESYEIEILDGETALVTRNCTGGVQKCRFDIDARSRILFGRYYNVKVTAKLRAWNNSATKNCYFGTKNCPKSVCASPIGTNKFRLKWEKPNDAAIFSSYTYAVEAVSEGNKALPRRTTAKTEMEIEDLKGGMEYFFRVATNDSGKYSLWSTSNKVRTEACSIQVEGFCLETNSDDPAHALDCYWDSALGAVSYQIQYTCHNHKKTILVDIASGVQQFVIQDLFPNTVYHATIKAQDSRGYGTPCGEKSKTTGLASPKDIILEKAGELLLVRFTPAEMATSHKVILRVHDEKGGEITNDATQGNKCSFADWDFNTKYSATVKAMYGKSEGGMATSEEIMTEPDTISLASIHVEVKEPDGSRLCLRSVFVVSTEVNKNCTEYKAWICCKDHKDESYVVEMDIDEEEKLAVKQYNCFHEGAKYGVMVKCRNQGGWSEWSGEKPVTTVPKEIENVMLDLDCDGLIAEWDNVPHATNNVLEFFVGGYPFKKVKKERSPCRLTEELEHGLEIYCKIYPVNTAGIGRITTSNTLLLPLDPPSLSSIIVEERSNKVKFTWTPSQGMKGAFILFTSSKLDEVERITAQSSWLSPPVVSGESYEFQIWAKNGNVKSKMHSTKMFVTAPSAVKVERNKVNPETSINVDIITEHSGPFYLAWRESNGKEICACIHKHAFTIEGLKPATNYDISARCLYGENYSNESAVCYATTLMTLPGQVTGVDCKDLKDGTKRLKWVGCGNQAVTYSISGKRNYVALETIKTKNTYLDLQDLNAGKYQFFVTAGSGKSSEPFSLIVPETPTYTFKLVTPQCVSVICTTVLNATKYEAELWLEKSLVHTYESNKGEFWMEYDLECGKEYMLKIYACCNDYRSEAAMHHFYADLPAPTDLSRRLDDKQPSKKVKFTWKTNELSKKTHLKLSDHNFNMIDDVIIVENEWEFGDLVPNREYTLKAYSNDQVRSYTNYTEVKFWTAPFKPDKLEIKKNRFHPETMFDVEIHADYNGPFMILVKKANEKEGQEIEKDSKRFTLDNMIPGCPYCFFVRCKFIDPVNEIEYYSAYTPFTGKK